MFRLTHTPRMVEDIKKNIDKLPRDCTLVCRNGRTDAHRIALSWASPCFLRMLSLSKSGTIFLPQFDVEDIQLLVELIYGRVITVDGPKMDRLVDCAQQLDICAFKQ